MSYASHFTSADATLAHLTSVVAACPPMLASQYAGFAAVSSVTVYELAIKEIFQTFAAKKHSVFGTFTERFFHRLNGRITIRDLRDEYLPRFGNRYKLKFETALSKADAEALAAGRGSVKASYGNLLTWRHNFAHGGNPACTFKEVVNAYELGKTVIACLDTTMVR